MRSWGFYRGIGELWKVEVGERFVLVGVLGNLFGL